MCERVLCFNLQDDDKNVCSGNGRCLSPNKCECINGFEGVKCDSCKWEPSGGICKEPWSISIYYIFSFLIGSGFTLTVCFLIIIMIVGFFIYKRKNPEKLKKSVNYDKELDD